MICQAPYDVTPRTSWRKELLCACRQHHERIDTLVATLSSTELDRPFDASTRTAYQPFTAWTFGRVYFPAIRAGKLYAASVPRSPCYEATAYIGR